MLLHKELSYKVVGCFYEVANKYGLGLKEIIYHKALEEELKKKKLKFESEKRIKIYSLESGNILGTYVPDFVIEAKIIIEIKSTSITTRHDINQQRSYLKASEYEVAYLVNFGTSQIDIRRSIFTNDRKSFIIKLKKIRDP